MKNTKKFKIIMLSSEKANNIILSPLNKLAIREDSKSYEVYGFKIQNLYIVSDEKVKEGDYCKSNPFPICGNTGILHCSGSGVKQANIDNCKKIIATTDKTLGLPIIPDQFLTDYIKSYNEGKQITEVELEMIELKSTHGSTRLELENNLILIDKIKTRPDNTVIIILEDKKLYNKEQLKEFAWKAYKYAEGLEAKYYDFEEWFNDEYI